MRIFTLELNNDIKGIKLRRAYIETLIAQLAQPDLILLPELALSGYIPNQQIWQYADSSSRETSQWATTLAKKYHSYIGVG